MFEACGSRELAHPANTTQASDDTILQRSAKIRGNGNMGQPAKTADDLQMKTFGAQLKCLIYYETVLFLAAPRFPPAARTGFFASLRMTKGETQPPRWRRLHASTPKVEPAVPGGLNEHHPLSDASPDSIHTPKTRKPAKTAGST
ncbi:MAG: hypothetical protein NVV63_00555 [Opitutus sp.]|nr:hypothetical protein [Opitutus sp.]